MMHIEDADIQALLSGQPPSDPLLLTQMTLGRSLWLDRIRSHYLQNYLPDGGSKVKVLVGDAGSGKTHLLKAVLADAGSEGYATVYLSAQDYRLNDLPGLYRAVVAQIDLEALVQGLCRLVARKLGYGEADGLEALVPWLCEDQGLTRDLAIQEVKKAAGSVWRAVDFSPSFLAFAHAVIQYRLIRGQEDGIRVTLKWLRGEKLERPQKQMTLLYERLQKINARAWFNSLIRLLRLSGFTGLVLAIDDLDLMAERSVETRRYRYTPSAVKDTCELFRQMIDEAEALDHFLLLLAGRPEMIEDERRGFKSYEALWMRLQTGLIPLDRFNPLADMVDINRHLSALGSEFPEQVKARLEQLLIRSGLPILDHQRLEVSDPSRLRTQVMKAALATLEPG